MQGKRIHSSYAMLSSGVLVKDPTSDLIFVRKTFWKPPPRCFSDRMDHRSEFYCLERHVLTVPTFSMRSIIIE